MEIGNGQDPNSNFHHTDAMGAIMSAIHFSGGNPLEKLAKAAADYFSGDQIDYGGAQQGDEVTGSGVTVKRAPGTVVTKNPDGTTTVTKSTDGGTSKTVLTFDQNGELIGTKIVTIEFTADGGAFQRIVNEDGTIRTITLAHGGEGQGQPLVHYDEKTGHTTLISVISTEERTKTVTIVDENGELIDRRAYTYDIMENGSIIENYVGLDGVPHQRTVVQGGTGEYQYADAVMSNDGVLVATTCRPDGTKNYAIVAGDSNDDVSYDVSYDVRADGAVFERTVSSDGILSIRELLPAAGGANTPTMTIGHSGSVTFIQTKEDGSKTLVYLDQWGNVADRKTFTFELRPDGSATMTCTFRHGDYDGHGYTKELFDASEIYGLPEIRTITQSGTIVLEAYRGDGSLERVTLSNDGKITSRHLETYDYITDADGNHRIKIKTTSLIEGGQSYERTIDAPHGWVDELGTNPSSDGPAQVADTASDSWNALYSEGGLWGMWERQLEWDIYGVSRYANHNASPQTIGDSRWSGWKENGGTVERNSVDFTGTVNQKGVQKTLRVKAFGSGDDASQGSDGIDMFYAGAGHDTLHGGTGGDLISGEDGNDAVYGDEGNDKLYGGNGNDSLFGGAGDDYLDDALEGTTDGVDVSGNDHMDGGDGNDVIRGRNGRDTLDGGLGDDYLTGDAGDDVLYGRYGKDSLDGGDGSDHLDAGEDDDFVNGADGHDLLIGWTGDDTLIGGLGADTLDGGAGDDHAAYLMATSYLTIDLTTGLGSGGEAEGDRLIDIEDVTGGHFGNTLIGNAQANKLTGGKAADVLRGGDGDDTLNGGAGDDVLDDAASNGFVYGNDSFDGGLGSDRLYGRFGNDTLLGGEGNDYIDGGEDDDYAHGGNGNDTLTGWTGNDKLVGDLGDDWMDGGAGNDSMDGGWDNDTLFGRVGRDTLWGAKGNDYLDAGEDDDYVDGGDGHDVLHGVTGDDALYGRFGNDSLYGGTGNDHLDAGEDDDRVDGGDGHDYIIGFTGHDVLWGRYGNDHLDAGEDDDRMEGGAGQDTLIGWTGNDLLNGGTGNDVLYGGAGADWFFFDANSGSDVIKDFGAGDVIRLSGITYSGLWGSFNKPVTTSAGTVITTMDGRTITIEGIRAEQLKGGVVNGSWEWHL